MNTKSHSALELNGLGVSFGQRVVLDGITLSLSSEGIDVLMGPVKVGKSTLLRTLAGLYEGHALQRSWGSVFILGAPRASENLPMLVQQHTRVLDLPLLQALCHPLRETAQRSSAEWRMFGLEVLSSYGLSEQIAWADRPLLQCDIRTQRAVSILSHVLLKPSLLMIDEPTFGLNDVDATWLLDWIKKVSAHCKLWVALHNQMQARRLADRIVLLGGGHVLAHQNTPHFFQRPANEWVEQFIRTGSLSLPAPDARKQDLADDVAAPLPLSQAAQAAIQPFFSSTAKGNFPDSTRDTTRSQFVAAAPTTKSTPVNRISISTISSETVLPLGHLVEPAAILPASEDNPPAAPKRKLVDLPTPSTDGVALASFVGNVIYRDSSMPRGFHWIVPGKLAGCPAPGVSSPIDYDMNLLTRVGITRLITLTETDLDQDILARNRLSNTHLPIFDSEAPSISQTHMLLIRMQKYLQAGEVLAVHCKAGLGRTGTILAAWLIRDGGLTATDSITRLRRIEPGFIQSAEQEAFLHLYEADINNRLL